MNQLSAVPVMPSFSSFFSKISCGLHQMLFLNPERLPHNICSHLVHGLFC